MITIIQFTTVLLAYGTVLQYRSTIIQVTPSRSEQANTQSKVHAAAAAAVASS